MATGTHPDSVRAVEALKRWRAQAARVFLADGRNETVPVPSRRNKWKQVQMALESLPWVRLEGLDSKGGILGVIENDEPATGLEDLADIPSAKVGEVSALLGLMLRAQDVALGHNTGIVTKTMDLNNRLADVLMSRLTAMERKYQELLDTLRELMEESGGDGFESKSAPLIEALSPHLIKKLKSGASALEED